jgi:predicted transcriptional regulator YdeE
MATEQPSYTILMQVDDFELRRYDPQIVAQTWVSGNQDAAGRQGFNTLANYIFGNNNAENGSSSKISMTAPVMQQPQAAGNREDESQKIAMTAPVSMQQTNGKWRVQFVMPSQYTMQTLPKPNNPDITLTELPIQTYAVITFSGLAGNSKVADKTDELRTWMQGQNLTATGTPELARYNPPWILPFMRRNEIMIAY